MALSTLSSHDVSQLPVMLDGDCVGSLSEERLMARVIESPALLDKAVESVMDAPYPVVDAHIDLAAVRLCTESAWLSGRYLRDCDRGLFAGASVWRPVGTRFVRT